MRWACRGACSAASRSSTRTRPRMPLPCWCGRELHASELMRACSRPRVAARQRRGWPGPSTCSAQHCSATSSPPSCTRRCSSSCSTVGAARTWPRCRCSTDLINGSKITSPPSPLPPGAAERAYTVDDTITDAEDIDSRLSKLRQRDMCGGCGRLRLQLLQVAAAGAGRIHIRHRQRVGRVQHPPRARSGRRRRSRPVCWRRGLQRQVQPQAQGGDGRGGGMAGST